MILSSLALNMRGTHHFGIVSGTRATPDGSSKLQILNPGQSSKSIRRRKLGCSNEIKCAQVLPFSDKVEQSAPFLLTIGSTPKLKSVGMIPDEVLSIHLTYFGRT